MELLATYTFGQALLTVLEFALLILWIWLAVTVVVDVFRSHDLSGWAKAGWVVLIVLLPLLGVLVYVIARGDKMKAHEVSQERLQETGVHRRRRGPEGSWDTHRRRGPARQDQEPADHQRAAVTRRRRRRARGPEGSRDPQRRGVQERQAKGVGCVVSELSASSRSLRLLTTGARMICSRSVSRSMPPRCVPSICCGTRSSALSPDRRFCASCFADFL